MQEFSCIMVFFITQLLIFVLSPIETYGPIIELVMSTFSPIKQGGTTTNDSKR